MSYSRVQVKTDHVRTWLLESSSESILLVVFTTGIRFTPVVTSLSATTLAQVSFMISFVSIWFDGLGVFGETIPDLQTLSYTLDELSGLKARDAELSTYDAPLVQNIDVELLRSSVMSNGGGDAITIPLHTFAVLLVPTLAFVISVYAIELSIQDSLPNLGLSRCSRRWLISVSRHAASNVMVVLRYTP
jgi:hypothetical protein